jgi:hypothetical protein
LKAALVYDGGMRDNGTPFYFRAAFAKYLGAELDWRTEAAPIPEGYDFYFHIDDGRDDLRRVPPKPWGYYATDSHLGPGPRRDKARQADIVWCAQKPFAEELKAEGVNAHWLPLACFPEAHLTAVEDAEATGQPLAEKVYDVAFVGHLQSPKDSNRIEFLSEVFSRFPNFRFMFGAFHEDMARVYHKARIGINHSVRDDLNMRFFELASIGVPQLCDSRMVGLEELGFEPFVHYLPYTSAAEAVSVVEAYIGDPDLWMMAENAKRLVRSSHRYVDRVERMLVDAQEFI